MKTPKSNVAWRVDSPDEESAVVVFARTWPQARRMGVQALEYDGEDAECRCERAPQFDKYGSGAVAGQLAQVSAYLAEGWHWECSWCEHRVDQDGCEDCAQAVETLDEAPHLETAEPVVDDAWDRIWCSKACREAWDTDRRARSEEAAWMHAETLRRWPGASEVEVLGNSVHFKFPGGQYPAWWRPREVYLEVRVSTCDQAAWYIFNRHAKAA